MTAPGYELRETHTGVVVLCGDRAYKIKKPITTDFLDFATPEAREHACRREYALNRRLAPDVYLGVAHLTDPIGGADEPVLVMRRMPENRRLSAVLDELDTDDDALRALVATVAAFHRAAPRGPDIDRAATADALSARWQTVLDPLRTRPPDLIDPGLLVAISARALRYLRGRAPLFDKRISGGHIVDGHGDLLTEDIFALPDGFRILDCLDFDDELRHLDRLDDIGFLAMDIEFHGSPALAARLLTEYRRATGDDAPPSLDHHYRAYRAAVRAKVDTIRYDQGDRNARDRAQRHLALAADHLGRAAVRLTLVGGLPGTGKSTVTHRLAGSTGSVVLSSDRVRKELAGEGVVSGPVGGYNTGIYAPGSRHRVYTELLDRAELLLAEGFSVVLDAGWPDSAERERARELAAVTDAELVELRCSCPRILADQRLRTRGASESDATPQLAQAISRAADPWPESRTIDTRQSIDAAAAAALRYWHDSAVAGYSTAR
ncbi:bifunctional aminoglycoside phosphotransferase/ATP-binding protein [Nocardia sp. NPDC003345]